MGRVKILRISIPALLCFSMMQAMPSHASVPERADLLNIARKFVDKIGGTLQHTDELLSGIPLREVKRLKDFDAIPDGERLIMLMTITESNKYSSQQFTFSDGVAGIKQDRRLMLSLGDFFAIANFPIFVDGNAGTARGWFIRENQPFELDVAAKKVIVHDQTLELSPEEFILDDNGDILVEVETLERWFNFTTTVNVQSQKLFVQTGQPWPVQERIARDKKQATQRILKKAELPLYSMPYQSISVPTADITLSAGLKRSPDNPPDTTTSHRVALNGDLLGHTANATINGTDQTKIRSVTLNLSKRSENADLLGPLHARAYEFNDVQSVSVPLAGGGKREQGIRFTNKALDTHLYDTTTNITGEAPPGWDVELYKDQQYLGHTIVEDDGSYVFNDILLFLGVNNIKIIKYGPQGEIQEEERTLTVDASANQNGGLPGIYNASLTLQNTSTYNAGGPPTDPDRNTPHFAATYEQQLANGVIWREGLEARQQNGDPTAFLHSGLVKQFDGFLLNADTALSSLGPFMGSLTGRTNLDQHRFSANATYVGKNYRSEIPLNEQDTPANYRVSTAANGPLYLGSGKDSIVRYAANISRTQNTDGDRSINAGLALTKRIAGVTAQNGVTYTSSYKNGESTYNVLDTFSLRGYAYGISWRSAINSTIAPTAKLKNSSLEMSRNFTSQLSGSAGLQYNFDTGLTSENLALNWRGEKLTISSIIDYDSNDELSARILTSFGIFRDPLTHKATIKARGVDNGSGVSAFVFLDKDGDNIFSKDDEPLEGAEVEAVQLGIKLPTNENGEVFLGQMSSSRVTDVSVREETLDFNLVSGFPGISLRSRPGAVTRLEFPIHMGSSIEGTAYMRLSEEGAHRSLANLRLFLYDGDGKVVKSTTTQPDGYYFFERIPPGRYWLMADANDAAKMNLIRPLPQEFTFTHTGGENTGNDFILFRGNSDIAISVTPDMSDFVAANPGIDIKAAGKDSIVMNLGSPNSNLLMSVLWYRLKMFYADLVAGTVPLVEPDQSNQSATTGANTLRLLMPAGSTPTDGYHRCSLLVKEGFSCGIEILPKGLEAAALPKDNKG